MLHRWVQLVLKEHKWGMSNVYEAKAGHLKRELEQWRDQLHRYADPNVTVSSLGQPMIDANPYGAFIRAVDEIPHPPESDLLLKSERLGEEKMLVFARQGLDQNWRIYNDLFVNRVHLSEQAIPASQSGSAWKTSTGREVPLPYVFADDVFFPKRLLRIKVRSTSLNCSTLESSDFALPLTPAFFDYFYPHELIGNKTILSVEVTPESVIATLKLPLRAGRNLQVSKVYSIQTDVIDIGGAIPALAYWPDFFAPDWKKNLAGCHLEPEQGLIVAPLASQGSLHAPTRDDGTQKPTRIWESEAPVAGFALKIQTKNNLAPEDVGVVLRNSLTAPVARNNQTAWKVAVDFGTSSTTVLVRKSGKPPDVLTLNPRTVLLTGDKGGAGENAIASNLYPLESVEPPFPTVLYEGEISSPEGGTNRYSTRFLFYPEESNRFVSEVKWGSPAQQGSDLPLKFYLDGLVRAITCEARSEGVGNLAFAWSYPLALHVGSKQAMKEFWSGVTAEYTNKVDMSVSLAQDGDVSESEAICRCLNAYPNSGLTILSDGFSIAVDIGGGSTDIGFWSAGNLLDQVSFKVAGNDILTREWCRQSSFIDALHKACKQQSEVARHVRSAFRDRPNIMANFLLAKYAHPSGDPGQHPVALAICKGAPGAPPWCYLRSMIYLFYSGISFYAGLHARKHPTAIREIMVYFGGRASYLVSWVTCDSALAEEFLKSAFLSGFNYGKESEDTGIPLRVTGPAVRFSEALPTLKHEVAYGLLSDELGGTVTRKDTTLLGEINWANKGGTVLDWDVRLDLDALYTLRPPANPQGGFADYFLTAVIPKYLQQLNLDEGLRTLRLNVADVQNIIKKTADKKTKVLQPVFASELIALMNEYATRTWSLVAKA
ncbi:MAG: hypothetical protein ABIH23_27270 [bacterium]